MLKQHKNHSANFKQFLTIVAVVAVLMGIIAGAVFQTVDVSESIRSLDVEKHFNATLMLTLWLSGAVLELFVYGIYAHLQNQEIQIDNQIILANKLDSATKSLSDAPAKSMPESSSQDTNN